MFHVKQTEGSERSFTFHVKQSGAPVSHFDFCQRAPYIRRHVQFRA
jgi:hypothetical protein